MEPKDSLLYSQEPVNFKAMCNISQQARFYKEELLNPCPTPKLKDHPMFAIVYSIWI
jgi:hypothetical protein